MSKEIGDPLWAHEKFMIQIFPGFDRGLIELMQRALCDIFAASNYVWISYGG